MTKKIPKVIWILLVTAALLVSVILIVTLLFQRREKRNEYVSHQLIGNKLTIETTLGKIAVEFISNEIANVHFTAKGNDPIEVSHAVIIGADGKAAQLVEDANELFFIREGFQVIINKSPLRIKFARKGKVLLEEADGYFKSKKAEGFRFTLGENEKIYGAGFRTTPLNRRGYRYELYNQAHYAYGENSPNLNFSVPFVLSSKRYGLLFDNAHKGWLDLDVRKLNQMEFSAIGGKMSYYVIAGEKYEDILEKYSRLTGFQPLPPIWALGNLQSRFGYRSQAETEDIVHQMIKAGYPLDAIIIDLFWFGLGTHGQFFMGDLDWYTPNWPDPAGMIKRLNDQGINTILITEPFILKESKNWDLAVQSEYLGTNEKGEAMVIDDFWFGPGGLIDIFKPSARRWFWEQYKRQIDIGVAGWWGDLGEPEKHPASMRHSVGMAEEVHNIYAHYWHKMLYDFYSTEYPEVRLFNLNRSGFAGSQRYSVFPWTGDVQRSWTGLKMQPAAILGMALSGIPYMHSDLGGFARGEPDEELYVRWMQFGVFNPLFRPHGDSAAPVEPIFYSQQAQEILKRYITLRYQLLPYNYSLAWLNSTKGVPLTIPLFFLEPDNTEVSELSDIYMWGPSMLVAPVLEKGLKSMKIYLPEGSWYDFFHDDRYQGGRWIEYPLTMENIPVFARGGGFIPMVEPMQNTRQYSTRNLIIHHYLDRSVPNSEFTLYSDDGLTNQSLKKGLFEHLMMQSMQFDDFMLISFTRKELKNYNGKPEKRWIELIIHGISEKPSEVGLSHKGVPIQEAFQSHEKKIPSAIYNREKQLLTIKFEMSTPLENVFVKF